MAKVCPLNDQPVLYLDCLECEYRMECGRGNPGKELEKCIDKEE